MPMNEQLVLVALPLRLRKQFDYLLPDGLKPPLLGMRVLVPFGSGEKVGLVVNCRLMDDHQERSKLKSIIKVLDNQPIFSNNLLALLNFSARYYHHALGDVYGFALPTLLRKGEPALLPAVRYWHITDAGKQCNLSELKAKKQRHLLELLRLNSRTDKELRALDISSAVVNNLEKKGWISSSQKSPILTPWRDHFMVTEDKPVLNSEQAVAVSAINNRSHDFACFTLEGITGSGKTEVYLNLIEPLLEKGRQALILVPEIGLTPQTIKRFKARFNAPVVTLHSGLNDKQRLHAWLQAAQGEAAIVIGTRSAIFTPMPDLGIIIVDEEHDLSFKQQEGFRYHARDLALVRARKEQIAVVLGSATPSLETLYNCEQGRYQKLILSQRAGSASKARHALIDIRHQRLESGVSPQLSELIQQHLKQGNQVMLFLNRRGFSPALLCHECGWIAQCQRCDTSYTLHQQRRYLACHHCGNQRPLPHQCEHCGSTHLMTAGVGTEQLQSWVNGQFPTYASVRIDRDNTQRKGELEQHLQGIQQGDYQILIGTQMLAKGHHFPDVTLVALIDIDQALFSSDLRASERLAQLYTQVAGRAGRASKPGVVALQTHHPEHELLQKLVFKGYQAFAPAALKEREQTRMPPYAFQALWRIEDHKQENIDAFFQSWFQLAETVQRPAELLMIGPLPAPMERRAGRWRYQLILESVQRAPLHQFIQQILPLLESDKAARRVRWSVDIDPQDFI